MRNETKASSSPPSLRTMLRSENTVPKISLAVSLDFGGLLTPTAVFVVVPPLLLAVEEDDEDGGSQVRW